MARLQVVVAAVLMLPTFAEATLIVFTATGNAPDQIQQEVDDF